MPYVTLGTAMRYCASPHCQALVEMGHCAQHARARDANRENADIRKWYHTARWRATRRTVLEAQPCCVECRRQGYVTAAHEVDHIVRHAGNPSLFWSVDNLQGLCTPCHSRKTQAGQ